MSNATSDLEIYPVGAEGRRFNLPVDGGSIIYKGTLVSQLTATGMLVPSSTASSGPAIGVAEHKADNSTGSDADVRCWVESDRIFLFTNGTSTDACSEATLLGATVYCADDHKVYDNDASGTLFPAGRFMGMEPTGKVRVWVTCSRMLASATVAALTDSSAGTANGTVEALPNPTDTPATADALRDDLVAVLIPALRNNFAELTTKINEFRTVLRAAGLMS